MTLRATTNALSLAPDVEWAVDNNLISAVYLQFVSKKRKVKIGGKLLEKNYGSYFLLSWQGMGHFMALKKRYY